YSFRRCPYAMRARLAITISAVSIELREVVLRDKPQQLLDISAKATVPVLLLQNGKVIDESLDIMLWALSLSDPDNLLYSDEPSQLPSMLSLIGRFDNEFKTHLENYKSAKRYHDDCKVDHRWQCEAFILELDHRLSKQKYLMGDKPSLVDYAILPYIRQFARVDRQWFTQAPYPHLQHWLKIHLTSVLFSKAMIKYPLWADHQQSFLIGK
ncbi:MAG: glutathione S-transferase, partial [Gammaproteobacteria bacterium]|nr:glutathione S-transferase [Gammaproteobacteria bacterium]